jgi:hypothetical protein
MTMECNWLKTVRLRFPVANFQLIKLYECESKFPCIYSLPLVEGEWLASHFGCFSISKEPWYLLCRIIPRDCLKVVAQRKIAARY